LKTFPRDLRKFRLLVWKNLRLRVDKTWSIDHFFGARMRSAKYRSYDILFSSLHFTFIDVIDLLKYAAFEAR
jgi:hypothetical protein